MIKNNKSPENGAFGKSSSVQPEMIKAKDTKSHRQNKASENRLIYKALREAKQPQTRRQLSESTGLEIATLCRALFNLIHEPQTIRITHYAPCKKTGKSVMHFYFNKKKGGRHENGN